MLHPPVDPNAEPIPTIMAGSTRAELHAGLAGRFLGRRRSYLIDSAYQV